MSVDKDTVRRVARLARLAMSEDALEPMTHELNQILGWIDQLSEVDTDGVPPMTSAVAASLYRRPDVVTDGDNVAGVTKNAPEAEDGFFTVPKVVE